LNEKKRNLLDIITLVVSLLAKVKILVVNHDYDFASPSILSSLICHSFLFNPSHLPNHKPWLKEENTDI